MAFPYHVADAVAQSKESDQRQQDQPAETHLNARREGNKGQDQTQSFENDQAANVAEG